MITEEQIETMRSYVEDVNTSPVNTYRDFIREAIKYIDQLKIENKELKDTLIWLTLSESKQSK